MGTFDCFQSNSLSEALAHCSNFALAVRNKKAMCSRIPQYCKYATSGN
jgi:hypothetical protein